MTCVTKNIVLLVTCIILLGYVSRAEAGPVTSDKIFYKLFFQSQPDSSFIGFDILTKCSIKNWQECAVG